MSDAIDLGDGMSQLQAEAVLRDIHERYEAAWVGIDLGAEELLTYVASDAGRADLAMANAITGGEPLDSSGWKPERCFCGGSFISKRPSYSPANGHSFAHAMCGACGKETSVAIPPGPRVPPIPPEVELEPDPLPDMIPVPRRLLEMVAEFLDQDEPGNYEPGYYEALCELAGYLEAGS